MFVNLGTCRHLANYLATKCKSFDSHGLLLYEERCVVLKEEGIPQEFDTIAEETKREGTEGKGCCRSLPLIILFFNPVVVQYFLRPSRTVARVRKQMS